MGVPQYRSREIAQSTPFRSHSPNRPSLMYSGYQLMLRVVRDQLLLHGRRADVPGLLRVVQQRGLASPAEGIGVTIDAPFVQQAALFQVGHDVLVGVLHELSGEGERAGDVALQVHLLHEGQSVAPARRKVFVAEGRRDMDDARPFVQRHKIPFDDRRLEVVNRLQNRRVPC